MVRKSLLNLNVLAGSLLLPVIILTFSCCSTKQTKQEPRRSAKDKKTTENIFTVESPRSYEVITKGQEISIVLSSKKNIIPDSITATIDGEFIVLTPGSINTEYTCNIDNKPYGRIHIGLNIYYSDSLNEYDIVKVLHLPKDEPKKLSYKVIRSFPHDSEAYTQGLIYKDGVLYESTGQQRRSSIRAINPNTGEVIRKKSLEPQYFGEGIAIVGNEIYMLTYRAQIGFVFDLVTFDLIRKFNLQTREGWGLTLQNDTIIMSDGSANLYFFSPDNYFTLLGQKEICNTRGLVNNINELEYTPDGLYSNVYGQHLIYLIDVKKGIVTHELDLTDLFPPNVPLDMDHVLNGIAYNEKSNTFYVTGKQWPVMYEISISAN